MKCWTCGKPVNRPDIIGCETCVEKRMNEQLRYEEEQYHHEIDRMVEDLVKSIDTLKYWEGVSDHFCECQLPIGSCLKCDMMRTIETLKDTLKWLKP